jgi:hypothetical protein
MIFVMSGTQGTLSGFIHRGKPSSLQAFITASLHHCKPSSLQAFIAASPFCFTGVVMAVV